MKRFKYRLETVLDYKNQILDNLKTEHAVIIQNVNRKQEEIKGLHKQELRLKITVCLICVSDGWRRL